MGQSLDCPNSQEVYVSAQQSSSTFFHSSSSSVLQLLSRHIQSRRMVSYFFLFASAVKHVKTGTAPICQVVYKIVHQLFSVYTSNFCKQSQLLRYWTNPHDTSMLIRTYFLSIPFKGAFPLGGTASGTAAVFSLITAAQIAPLYFSFCRFHLAATGAGRVSRAAVPAAGRSGPLTWAIRAGIRRGFGTSTNQINSWRLSFNPSLLVRSEIRKMNFLRHFGVKVGIQCFHIIWWCWIWIWWIPKSILSFKPLICLCKLV